LAREPAVHFIAVSKAIRARAIEYGIPAEKVIVRYIGVDTSVFRPGPIPISERRKRILFVGRLVEKKGTEYLIRAFAQVRNKVIDAELVIAGDGPLRESLVALARSLNIPVDFRGAVSSDEVKQQMHQARVFCLPSIIAGNGDAEGLPIVILEAQASGVPVVTSAKGGVGEAVLHNDTGMVFEEGMVNMLTHHLTVLLNDADLATTFSARARIQVAAQFSLTSCSGTLETTYEEIAASHLTERTIHGYAR
jgi:glycosyltransferase involved in cell wall biosynthesis